MRKRLLHIGIPVLVIAVAAVAIGYTRYTKQTQQEKNRANLNECLATTDFIAKTACASTIYAEQISHRSGTAVLSELEALQKEGRLTDCHEVSHAVGEALLGKYAGNVGNAFLECNHNCIDGCFHGIMESKVKTSLRDTGTLTGFLEESCTGFTSKDLYWQCSHGLGHGLAGHGNLAFEQALDACFLLKDPNVPGACTSGVIMEYIDLFLRIKDQDLAKTIPIICDEPKKIDIKGKPGLANECTAGIGQNLMMFTGYNIETVTSLCSTLPTDEAEICSWSAEVEYNDHLKDLGKLQ